MHDLEAFGENLLYLKDLVDVSWVYRRELCIYFEVPGVGGERKGFFVLFIDQHKVVVILNVGEFYLGGEVVLLDY